jgi:adenosine deaminase
MKTCTLLLLTVLAAPLAAQSHAPLPPAEARATRALEAAKKSGSPSLYAFLKPFPKGADLHMHLDGAVYAETFLSEAAEQGLCVDPATLSFEKADPKLKPGTCAPGHIRSADALADETLYDKLIDSFSLRSFVPSAGWSAHDQFFATFGHFSGLPKSYKGAWLNELATRAAAQNEQYLEIMTTPTYTDAVALGFKLGWPAELTDANHIQVLAKLRDALLAGGLRDDVPVDTKELSDAQASRTGIENCTTEELALDHYADRHHNTTAAAAKTEYFSGSP